MMTSRYIGADTARRDAPPGPPRLGESYLMGQGIITIMTDDAIRRM
jgi:hypothetical protein